jgi:Uncharacterised nucleotidyltransferase
MPELTDAEVTLCQLIAGSIHPRDIAASDWSRLLEAAQSHMLTAYLWHVLSNERFSDVPAEVKSQSLAETRDALSRYMLLENAYHVITSALSNAGIAHLWLKGIALANSVYTADYTRHMSDLDVIVSEQECQRAIEILKHKGFYPLPVESALLTPSSIEPATTIHHYTLQGGAEGLITLEIHYRLFGLHARHLEGEALAYFGAHTCRVGKGIITLQPETHLVYLCAHIMLQHGESDLQLRRYLDIHLLITVCSLNWDEVMAAAQNLGWGYSLQRVLQTTRRLFDTLIPDLMLTTLDSLQPPDRELATRLQTGGFDWKKIRLAMNGMGFWRWLGFLLHILIPPRDYMRVRYHIASGVPVWRYYFYRWFKQAQKLLLRRK